MKVVDKVDFGKDINIPKKSIIMDGDFNKRESFFVEKMQDGSKYQEAKEKNLATQINVNISSIPFDIHNKLIPTNIINIVLKDIIARYSIINGFNVNSSIGFFHTDEMLNKKSDDNEDGDNISPLIAKNKIEQGLIGKNRKSLEANIRSQIFDIMNLGVMINYSKHYYSTLKSNISEKMLNKFESLYKTGRIHHEIRPVTWCAKCGESVTSSKIKYRKSKVDNSYILFKIKNDNENLKDITTLTDTYIVSSTIRPWVMIYDYNLVVAKDTEYALVQVEDVNKKVTKYIIAKEVADKVMLDAFFLKYTIEKTFSSDLLDGIILANPLNESDNIKIFSIDKKLVLVDNNNLTGINIVSNADTYLDYIIMKKIGQTNFKCVIDKNGIINNLVPEYKGKSYKEVNKKIIEKLTKSNNIFLQTSTVIIIPRCKACNEEIIYRDLNKWFLVRNENENEKLKICFENIISKINDSVTNNKELLNNSLNKILRQTELDISDERQCNVPIPAFTCASCGEVIINDKTIKICKDILLKDGIDKYNKMTPDEILNKSVKCPKCDCDFLFKDDSSINDDFKLLTLPMFNIEKDPKFPNYRAKQNVNLCIESRKSFLRKLKVSTFDDNAATKINHITRIMLHPQTREENKKANDPLFINPSESEFSSTLIKTNIEIIDIVKKYGIDVLRLWAIYRSNKQSMRLSEGDIITVRNIYVKFRKTIKYILSNLYDFDPTRDFIEIEKRDSLDKYLYNKMQKIENKLFGYYNQLNFRGIYKTLFVFSVNSLQENYFEAIRYRLYITKSNGFLRRSTQSTLYELFELLLVYLSPILPLLFEECWPYLHHKDLDLERNNLLFRKRDNLVKIELTQNESDWDKIFSMKKKILPYINKACNEHVIKTSLNARLDIFCNEEGVNFIKTHYEDVVRTLNVSEVFAKVGEKFDVKVRQASGVACARCKNYSVDIGLNYKYRYLCPICAEIEENMDKFTYDRKEHLKFPKDPELVKLEEKEAPPPPKFEPIIDTNFDDDRNFDDDYQVKVPQTSTKPVSDDNFQSKIEGVVNNEILDNSKSAVDYSKSVPNTTNENSKKSGFAQSNNQYIDDYNVPEKITNHSDSNYDYNDELSFDDDRLGGNFDDYDLNSKGIDDAGKKVNQNQNSKESNTNNDKNKSEIVSINNDTTVVVTASQEDKFDEVKEIKTNVESKNSENGNDTNIIQDNNELSKKLDIDINKNDVKNGAISNESSNSSIPKDTANKIDIKENKMNADDGISKNDKSDSVNNNDLNDNNGFGDFEDSFRD